jgi:uncharacterized protein (TIGR02246 family)
MGGLVATDCEIRQLHARYADAMFRKDAAAAGALFAADGVWHVAGQVAEGRDAILSFLEGAFPQFRNIMMTFRTPIVDVLDGQVVSRSWVTETRVMADGEASLLIGIYFDRFVEEDGKLLLGWRQFQTHYLGPPDLSADMAIVADYGPPPAMPPL